jgi:arylsulfatase A-like enzyme
MIIRAPGITNPGSISEVVTTSTDHYPTLLELAGLKAMPEQHKDGKSLVPAIEGGTLDRETIYWHYPHFHGSTWAPGAALRSGKWKLIDFYELNKVELFDLESDPSEQNDLSKVYPEKTAALLNQLHRWQASVNAKMPTLNPAFNN